MWLVGEIVLFLNQTLKISQVYSFTEGGGYQKYDIVSVPDVEAGHCLGPEGNGVSLWEVGEGGPQRSEGDKQSVLNEGRDNMGKDEEERASWA
jgi:hypothetical protein